MFNLDADAPVTPAQTTTPEAPTAESRPDALPRRLPSPDRHTTVMPLDLRQATFGTALRGFARSEVTTFLLDASEGYELALRENERLRQEVARLEASLALHREMEATLKSTMLTAQQVADGMRENAMQEAARLLRDAEGRAGLLIERARAGADDVQREIDGLRMKRREAETGVESIISILHHTLAFVREQEERERAETSVPARPRMEPAEQPV